MSLFGRGRRISVVPTLAGVVAAVFAVGHDRVFDDGVIEIPNGFERVVPKGRTAVIVHTGGHLSAIELRSASPSGIAGDHGAPAVVASGADGLRIVEVRDSAEPVEIARLYLNGPALDVEVLDGNAYVAAGPAGLRIVDVTTPQAPFELGGVTTPDDAIAISVRGDLVVLATSDGGLVVFDVADPSHPREIGSREISDLRIVDVVVDGSYVWAAAGGAGLAVVDISSPGNPRLVSRFDEIDAFALALMRRHVVVAAGADGVMFLPRSRVFAPRPEAIVSTRVFATGVEPGMGFFVVTGHQGLIEVVDLESDLVFTDGFESGSWSSWSSVFPPDPGVDCSMVTLGDLREGGNSQMATFSNGLDVEIEIVRTRYTFPLFDESATTNVDYFSIEDNSHANAYWDGTGYSPVDEATWVPERARLDGLSSTLWYVDLDGSWAWPEYWNGTYEVCLDVSVFGTTEMCPDICASATWVSTAPTLTPTRTPTRTPTPTGTATPTPTPPSPTPTPEPGKRGRS